MSGYAGCACFWLEQTGRVGVSLRRYCRDEGEPCPLERGYHDASTGVLWYEPLRLRRWPDGYLTMAPVRKKDWPKRRDPRWPTHCECGYRFKPADVWQVNEAEEYARGDTGELVTFRGYGDPALAGALFDGWWLHNYEVKCKDGGSHGHTGPDGIALVAVCPNGAAWPVDGPAHDGERTKCTGWTRSGDPRDPPTLTVSPSIIAGDYHGHLQGGSFTAG